MARAKNGQQGAIRGQTTKTAPKRGAVTRWLSTPVGRERAYLAAVGIFVGTGLLAIEAGQHMKTLLIGRRASPATSAPEGISHAEITRPEPVAGMP